MKEKYLGETFEKSYVAVPLCEGPIFQWVRSMNGFKKFYHVSIYYLHSIGAKDVDRVRDTLSDFSFGQESYYLIPEKLSFLGTNENVFALELKKTDFLLNIRQSLEKTFPEKNHQLPFHPHITIKQPNKNGFSSREKSSLLKIPDISNIIPPEPIRSIGLYYKTEEGATAQLYLKKFI